MREAKAFFIVCASVCLLALSYHLGAERASAQVLGAAAIGIEGASIGLGGRYEQPYASAVIGGRFFVWERSVPPAMTTAASPRPTSGSGIPVPVPGDGRVVATAYSAAGRIKEALVLRENGDVYWYAISTAPSRSGTWRYGGNLCGVRPEGEMDSLTRSR